ncbi:MAG: sigma-54-dependent Fis family transcriptional regulator [Myxococcota bacterium]
MPDRAEKSLSARALALEAAYEAAGDEQNAAEALERLVWCRVEQGLPGDAFGLLWEDGVGRCEATREALRAELQAFCGNEQAALSLSARMTEGKGASQLVRARVAAGRGDWEAARELASSIRGSKLLAHRASCVTARASIELGDADAVDAALLGVKDEGSCSQLERQMLAARASHDRARVRGLADEALVLGANRLAADAWADLAQLERLRQEHARAREAASRAVELWDDMATSLPPPLRAGFWNDARRAETRSAARAESAVEPTTPTKLAGTARLLENLRSIASERDLPRLLSRITDGAVALSGAERGFVLLVDASGALEPATIRTAEAELGERTAAFSQSIAETVLIDGEPIVTVDAALDARVQDYLSVHQLMLKSVACLPIVTHGRTWGVLYLEHRGLSGRFAGADLRLLRAYADQAAIAIETSQLLSEVATQRVRLEEANRALQEANRQLESQLEGQTQALQRTNQELARLQVTQSEGARWGIVGESPAMRAIYEVLDRVGASEVPVVVSGESGTGKELVARAIHRSSPRGEGPFVSLNCGAIPEGLLESELFGHVRGAFTGAIHDRRGVFAEATNGTLFLDEVGDMPSRMQLDLLRVLQEGRVRPVGGSSEVPIDVRLVTASRRPLDTLVKSRTLREDLYYRLAVVQIQLPPLRERLEDIPLLCDHVLARLAKERKEPRKTLDREATRRLLAYDFPGNVRELEHLLLNASVFVRGDIIGASDLALEGTLPARAPQGAPDSYSDFKGAERARIVATLNAHGWNRAKAARALGMARRTFYRRLKEHAIKLPKQPTE